jgi:hypothetical protein
MARREVDALEEVGFYIQSESASGADRSYGVTYSYRGMSASFQEYAASNNLFPPRRQEAPNANT